MGAAAMPSGWGAPALASAKTLTTGGMVTLPIVSLAATKFSGLLFASPPLPTQSSPAKPLGVLLLGAPFHASLGVWAQRAGGGCTAASGRVSARWRGKRCYGAMKKSMMIRTESGRALKY